MYETDGVKDIPFDPCDKVQCCMQITHREWGEALFYGADIPGSVLVESLVWSDGEWISLRGVSIPGHLIPHALDVLKSLDISKPTSEDVGLWYSSFRQANEIRFSISKNSDRAVGIALHCQCVTTPADCVDDGFRYVGAIAFPNTLLPGVVSGIESVTKLHETDVLSWYDLNKRAAAGG